jgi:hypothetical protein
LHKRFWKTIYEEFLVRAQFVSFEEARERIRNWVQYYNHKRPHQGIGGLCPADRFFEIQAELKKTIEQGIADNVLEMALRGKPKEPFYMVGRMEGQSVVLRAEKGRLRLMVDDEKGGGKQEVVYDVTAEEEKIKKERGFSMETTQREETDGKAREAESGETCDGGGQEKTEGVRSSSRGEVPGGALGMDGETETRGGMSRVGSGVEYIESVAGAGDGRDAHGPAATDSGDGEERSIEFASCGIIGAEEQERGGERIGAAFGPAPVEESTLRGEFGQAGGEAGDWSIEEGLRILMEIGDGRKGTAVQEEFDREEQKACASAGVGNPPGAQWSPNGKAGSSVAGGVAQDVLRVGGEVAKSHGLGAGESSFRKTSPVCGSGEGGPSGANPGVGEEAGCG